MRTSSVATETTTSSGIVGRTFVVFASVVTSVCELVEFLVDRRGVEGSEGAFVGDGAAAFVGEGGLSNCKLLHIDV